MFRYLFLLIFLISFLGFSQNETYQVINIGLNNENPHFGLSYKEGDEVLFTSYLLNKSGAIKISSAEEGILTLYSGKTSEKGNIIDVNALQIDGKEGITHITSACYSPNGKHLYIATTYSNRKIKPKGNYKESNFHLEMGEYVNGVGWTNFKVLQFCKPIYSYGHPAISPDGKTLYFVANIRTGKQMAKGPSDLFKVNILRENTFSEPINLGSKVNSYSKEMFPFISADTTLYFASNRINGFGDFDIYKSKINANGTFNKAELLPEPINSKEDDFSFIIDKENKTGYFSSKRSGGKGGDDVYYFTLN
jgi:hypothetical protein